MLGDGEIPEKTSYAVYVLFALAAISGGLGGCTIASHKILTGNSMRVSYLMAYSIIGAAFGVIFASYGWILSDAHPSEIIGPSLLAGMVGSAALGGMNWTARFILKHLGVEIQVTMRKPDEERRVSQ